MSMVHSSPKLLTGRQFIADLTRAVQKSKSRVAIMATTLHDDCDDMHALIAALRAAAQRGVIVTVSADSYTYIEPKELIIKSPKRQPVRAYRALQTERHLKSDGVDFRWLGRLGNFVFAGRTHAKWMVVDDMVFSFGGVNLDSQSFDNTDYMLRFDSRDLADKLFNEHLRVNKADRGGHASRSHSLKFDSDSQVLVDGALIGDSIIYRRAVRLAREAKSMIVVSQYCPTGSFARIAKRKHAQFYFNHWRHANSINKGLIGLGMLSSRQRTAYERDNYLHAKFIIFTMPDGHKVALSGSHNFMFSSVVFGTREVALETTNTRIIKQLENFFEDYLA